MKMLSLTICLSGDERTLKTVLQVVTEKSRKLTCVMIRVVCEFALTVHF